VLYFGSFRVVSTEWVGFFSCLIARNGVAEALDGLRTLIVSDRADLFDQGDEVYLEWLAELEDAPAGGILGAPSFARRYVQCGEGGIDSVTVPTVMGVGFDCGDGNTPCYVPPDEAPFLVIGGEADSRDYFQWPSTDVAVGGGTLTDRYFVWPKGMLSYLGYHVGRSSNLTAPERHRILDGVFGGVLPLINDEQYMSQWGGPGTCVRLQKMAESLAAFTRNEKHQDPDKYAVSISQREADLDYLYHAYYVGRCDFPWPESDQ